MLLSSHFLLSVVEQQFADAPESHTHAIAQLQRAPSAVKGNTLCDFRVSAKSWTRTFKALESLLV